MWQLTLCHCQVVSDIILMSDDEWDLYPVYTGMFERAGPFQLGATWSNVPVYATGLSWERPEWADSALFDMSELA